MMVASNGLGGVLGSLLAGQVLDRWGVDWMLLFCAACAPPGSAGRTVSAPAQGRVKGPGRPPEPFCFHSNSTRHRPRPP